ncbi:helix-turn-helix domain-containing protein [Ereboglobus sp. PH5-10]|uniref:helix-turn-helix domain-containing protein n=1 Tax=Ereboglobus sp. PH5-10 TaxID=2940629 RepID=UPI002406CAF9|nr:helix-turn-helix domain-containing protein [Ereboglobus sp. PH5-10]
MPRPIHDEADYNNTVEMVDMLAGHDLTPDQEDYLVILAGLIETYEKEHVKESLPKNANVLGYLMQEHGITGDGLARILGIDRSTAYRLVKGERNLTVPHIKTLAKHFNISTEAFM